MKWPWSKSKGYATPQPKVVVEYPLLKAYERPLVEASPDQWFDWIAAHAVYRADWREIAARKYREKWPA